MPGPSQDSDAAGDEAASEGDDGGDDAGEKGGTGATGLSARAHGPGPSGATSSGGPDREGKRGIWPA